ncbi:MAG TPA: bifunctional diguanylate cyclase/phosphodiesterase, partial [Thermoleophilaceae bacterium]|nr:bifunctional diguanylate cyclase/phosphodiesterase [Thermoleophilaceae bacterium]
HAFTGIAFPALAASVILGELFPLELPRRSGDGEVTVSTMFSFALVLGVGLLPALAAQLAASIVQDLIARKPLWQVGFNVGQYTLSLGAAAGVVHLLLGHTLLAGHNLGAIELLAVMAAAAAFFSANLLLVARATTLYVGTPYLDALRTDLGFGMSVSAVLLCLAPVLVTVLDASPVLFPLLYVPLLGVYAGGRQSVRTAKAEHMATHDSLTELPNRRWFRDAVNRAVTSSTLRNAGLLLIDLNRFKEVNDTLGHHHGDSVLRQLGPRIRAAFGEEDFVARLGGDEFAVFMPGADAADVEAAVDRLQDAVSAPVFTDGISIEMDASVGLAWYPFHGGDVDTLLERADVAMYRAKATQCQLVTYRPEDDYHSPARVAMATDLRRGIEEQQLVLHYQPQLDLALGVPVAAEGLVRWNHPQKGLVPPAEFIEVAEHAGLIKDLTYQVIELGLKDLREWQAAGRDLSLSLNISVRSLLDRHFPREVQRLLTLHGVSGHALTLELTESSLMADPAMAKKAMNELSELGVSFAIDDFGTGYSSLAYLADLPVRELKIDRSFVMAMHTDSRNRIIVRSTIELARNLGLRTVAEGIEDRETFDVVRDLGCELAQGYYMSRPLPFNELERWWVASTMPLDAKLAAERRAAGQPAVTRPAIA